MDREEGGTLIMERAEIDTGAPFKSVKEAVLLFGERVLVGEIYANKLKEVLPLTFCIHAFIHVFLVYSLINFLVITHVK